MHRSALASGLFTFWSTLTNRQIIFKPLHGVFLKKMRILPMKRRFRRSLSFNIIDILKSSKIRATIRYFFLPEVSCLQVKASYFSRVLSPSLIFT